MSKSPPSSPMEEDPAKRQKKVWIQEDGVVGDWMDEGVVIVDVVKQNSESYKEVLMEVLGSEEDEEEYWGDFPENKWYKEEEEARCREKEASFTPGVEIQVLDVELALWSKPWQNALVVKVLGKKVNFKLMEKASVPIGLRMAH